MQKILEIKGKAWMSGLSLQTGFPIGGLFRSAAGFDPFEDAGYLKPSLSSSALTDPSVTINQLLPYSNGGAYVFAVGNRDTNNKCLYQINVSTGTVTDRSTWIHTNISSGTAIKTTGAIIYKNVLVYGQDNSIRSVKFDGTSDTNLESSNTLDYALSHRPFCIGADLNLYYGNQSYIGEITNVTGTSGNSGNSFRVDSDMVIRGLANDGRYLVIIADNNTDLNTLGAYRCRVYFWDMVKTDGSGFIVADKIWDLQDTYMIGAQFNSEAIHIFGYNNLYLCTATASPKAIISFIGSSTITKRPVSQYMTTVANNSVYWGDSDSTGQNIYAYGSSLPVVNSIFYSPYIVHDSTYAQTALCFAGGRFYAAVDKPGLYVVNSGSTRGSLTVQTSPTVYSNPFTLKHIKVSLKAPLSSGQAVSISATNANADVISDTETKSYSASNPRKNLKFDVKAVAGSNPQFEDLSLIINPQAGAEISRVSVYAVANDDSSQTL